MDARDGKSVSTKPVSGGLVSIDAPVSLNTLSERAQSSFMGVKRRTWAVQPHGQILDKLSGHACIDLSGSELFSCRASS